MIVAYGLNQLEVPCRFFPDADAAKAFTDKWMTPEYVVPNGSETKWRTKTLGFCHPDLAAALFTNYYGGCGHAGAFELKPLPMDQPFLAWDLD